MKNVSTPPKVGLFSAKLKSLAMEIGKIHGKILDAGQLFGYNICVLGESLDPRLLGKI